MKSIAVALVLAVSSATACTSSKVLTESRAKTLISEALQSESYIVSTSSIAPFMSPSINDYRTDTADAGPRFALKRLLDEGLITQNVSIIDYPNISGQWVMVYPPIAGNEGLGPRSQTIQVRMAPNSNEGFAECLYVNPDPDPRVDQERRGNAKVTISPSGRVTIEDMSGSCVGRGEHMRYQYGEDGAKTYLREVNGGSDPNVFNGGPSRENVRIRMYEYIFSPEVHLEFGDRGGVGGGGFDVGEVANLQLVTETRAEATFAWKASLNMLGRILGGDSQPAGTGTAEFAKKPDGTWVLVNPIRF